MLSSSQGKSKTIMTTDIKVGDKVRLTENYKMAFDFSGEGVVIAIMDECGLVALRKCHTISWISLCDLIKVEEAKEPKPKYHKGDKVWFQGGVHVIAQDGYYQKVWGKYTYMVGDICYDVSEDELQPYTEPTGEKKPEVTQKSTPQPGNGSEMNGSEAETTQKSPSEKKNGSESMIFPTKPILSVADPNQEVEFDIDWAFYTADLAKEIVLKVADICDKPEVAAEYAVSVAKAVAEGLKKK